MHFHTESPALEEAAGVNGVKAKSNKRTKGLSVAGKWSACLFTARVVWVCVSEETKM